jgi:secreted trypsin-like serine protease
VDQKDVQQIYITYGQNPESQPLQIAQWYQVTVAHVHPGYDSDPYHLANDLALLELDRALPASRVMKLATSQQVQLPLNFMSVGYGITTDSSDPKLQADGFHGLFMVMKKLTQLDPEKNFFSLDQTDHKGFCNGDSGGPGVIQDPKTKEYLILGVVSNSSMSAAEQQSLNPNGAYSMCVGHGNYSNTLNPDLRAWIESTRQELEKSSP